jgi:hypothetical protein
LSTPADDADLRSLRRLEPWFYRAPSAHNTQPWVLTYERDRIGLGFDPGRHLAVGDPTKRDLLLGLGALVETVLVTVTSEGFGLAFEPAVEGESVGEFVRSERVYETPFGLDDLERRQTSRLSYDEGRLESSTLADARGRLAPGERLHEIQARELLPLFVEADRQLYESPAAMGELRRWLRLSRRDPDYFRDGLTYESLDLSSLEARMLAVLLQPRIYPLVRVTRSYRAFTRASKSLLDVEGSVLVLERDGQGPGETVESGRSLMRVWLQLSRAGVYTHPLSQIIDHALTERRLVRRLGLSETQRILSVFRVGRSEPPPRSHRLA